MNTLRSFKVEQLLGEFDHEINFTTEKEFVILHGPNGVGKTKLLELLAATLSFDIFRISELQFAKLFLHFDDDVDLTVTNNSKSSGSSIDVTWDMKGGMFGQKGVSSSFHIPLDEIPPSFLREVEMEIRTMLSVDAAPSAKFRALEHSGRFLPAGARASRTFGRRIGINLEGFDPQIPAYLDQFSVHMVETQRLLILDRNHEGSARRRPGESFPQRMKVSECANDLASRIATALTENSMVSQEQDKSFPRRVLDQSTDYAVPTEDKIREAYSAQSVLRNRLSSIALLDESMDVPLPPKKLIDWQKKVLWTYLEDSQKKLDSFTDLLTRVELFREIISSRFQFKRMVIDRRAGFRFANRRGDSIAPEQLSSGEQHEIVLIYDLLFEVKPGSLVLIDEPEISLHVAWQLEFLEDIRRIAAVSKFHFIVATHSPQIVNEWWSETLALSASPSEAE
ncbi:AAA family ATPase [Streptomyces sp. NPDC059631]|uniref:AAA family ATPase n=1 Tax=unclassified Streptomyces TaxID=2593676 RepID=UPI003682BFAE